MMPVPMPRAPLDESLVREAARAVPSSDDIRFDLAGPDEYDQVEALSRSAPAGDVVTPLTARLITWFVDRNPAGRGFVVIARDRGRGAIVGHFVFYPWRLALRPSPGATPESVTAYLFVRLYVDPAWRRRGVFSAMTIFGLTVAEWLGARIAYTAPNPRSAGGFVKLGMSARGPLPFWARPATRLWDWVGGAGHGRVDVRRVRRFDEAMAVPDASTLPSTTLAWGRRDVATLNWRYTDRPDAAYAIRDISSAGVSIGYLVTRRMTIGGRQVLAVCDAWTRPDHVAGLRHGLRDALLDERGVRLAIAIGGTAAPTLATAYRRAGFIRCPTALLPQPVAIYGVTVGTTAPLALPESGAWHLTPYDWDVF